MFSLSASGTLGKAIVYATWKGIAYVRKHAIPANPKSPAQVSMRSMMRFLSQIWNGLTGANKTTWDARAAVTNVSPFNAFVGFNQSLWNTFRGPTKEDPPAEIGSGGLAPTTTITVGVKELSLSIADGATPPDWGWLIHSSLTTGFTPSRSTIIAAVERTATPTVFLHTPLTTGVEVFYRIQGFSDDSALGILEAQVSDTPT